jgi:hypothetical protein
MIELSRRRERVVRIHSPRRARPSCSPEVRRPPWPSPTARARYVCGAPLDHRRRQRFPATSPRRASGRYAGAELVLQRLVAATPLTRRPANARGIEVGAALAGHPCPTSATRVPLPGTRSRRRPRAPSPGRTESGCARRERRPCSEVALALNTCSEDTAVWRSEPEAGYAAEGPWTPRAPAPRERPALTAPSARAGGSFFGRFGGLGRRLVRALPGTGSPPNCVDDPAGRRARIGTTCPWLFCTCRMQLVCVPRRTPEVPAPRNRRRKPQPHDRLSTTPDHRRRPAAYTLRSTRRAAI